MMKEVKSGKEVESGFICYRCGEAMRLYETGTFLPDIMNNRRASYAQCSRKFMRKQNVGWRVRLRQLTFYRPLYGIKTRELCYCPKCGYYHLTKPWSISPDKKPFYCKRWK